MKVSMKRGLFGKIIKINPPKKNNQREKLFKKEIRWGKYFPHHPKTFSKEIFLGEKF